MLISLLLQWSTAYGRCIHLSTSVTDRQLRPVLWTLNVFSLILLLPLFLSHFFSSSSSPWTSTFLLNVDTRTMHRITANTMLQHGPTQLFFMLSLKKVPQQEFKKKNSITFCLSAYIFMYQARKTGKYFSPCLTPKVCIIFLSCQKPEIMLEQSQNLHLQRYRVKICLSQNTLIFWQILYNLSVRTYHIIQIGAVFPFLQHQANTN